MDVYGTAFRLLFLESQIEEATDDAERDKAAARLDGGCEIANAVAFAGSPASIRLAIADVKEASGPRPQDPPSAGDEHDRLLAAALAGKLHAMQRGFQTTPTTAKEDSL